MDGRNLEIAVIGAGLVGKRHVDVLETIDGMRLSAIVDPSEEARHYAANLGVAYYTDMEALFAAERPDGVVISTPTPLHVDQGRLAIEAGCAALIEKPIAVSSQEARGLVELSEAKNVPVLVGHHRRYNPIIEAADAAIRGGKLGDVRAVNVTCWFYKPDHYFEIAPWRKEKGAGPISVNLVHDVDLMRALCGEVVSVQAQATPARRGFANEDVAAAVLRFENDAIGTITVSDAIAAPWSWEHSSGEYPIYPKTDESAYLIGGSEGSLSIPDLALWTHEGAPDWWTPIKAERLDPARSDPLVNQMRHFGAVILGEAEPRVSGREGLRTLAVVEAIQNAATTGETVFL